MLQRVSALGLFVRLLHKMKNALQKLLCFSLVLFCCSAFANTKLLVVSDIHYGKNNTSLDGSDAGDSLLALTMSKIQELSADVDFILFLGDIPTHFFGYSPDKASYEASVFHGLFTADSSNKPMFYVSGNNDSIAGNYQPFTSDGISPLSYADDWHGACVYCDNLLLDARFMHTYDYYSSYVLPNNKDLLLIVLNTTQFMVSHALVPNYPNQDHDAKAQLAWLREQLKNNHAKQVLIAMHEPPGMDYLGNPFWKKEYLEEFLNILQQNQANYGAVTLLTSHTHMDEIRHIDIPGSKPIYAFSTPAVSRIYHNNSGMKIFELDNQMQLKDYTTFYTSSDKQWGKDQYHAVSFPAPIFPDCQNKTLPQCLEHLSKDQVCEYIEQGLFYGVKSPDVPNQICRIVYQVGL